MRTRWVVLACLVVLAGCASLPTGDPRSPTPASPTTTVSSPTATPSTTDQVTPPDARTVTVDVREVVDGDTVDIVYANGTRDTVRLVGVDTPEVYSDVSPGEFAVPDTEAGRNCLREWAHRASDYAEQQVGGRTITLHFDPNLPRRGYYGRLLAYVTVDGRHLNYALVREGYARVYDNNFALRSAFFDAQDAAQRQSAGLWACRAATETPDDAPLAVSVHADAAGNDNENLNDEYVTFENREADALDLSGWTVSDAAGHTYTFDALELGPGESVTLYTGSGTDAPGARYWGETRAVWNNDGDTVVVRDAEGRVVVERRYGG